jgi:salicylate hydroxylase
MGRRRLRRRRRQADQQSPEPLIDVAKNCRRIAIVGAGLCGLAVALELEQVLDDDDDENNEEDHDENDEEEQAAAGHHRPRRRSCITIYERDESLEDRRDGYGLTLSYRPDGTLDKLGILDALADFDCASRSHYILRGDGRLLGYYGHAITGSGYGQRGNLRVPRQRVRQVLVRRLQRTKICWNHRLVDLRPEQQQQQEQEEDNGDCCSTGSTRTMMLSFQNGTSVVADLVIATDGIHSDVVRLWWPNLPPPRPLGVRLILGLTRRNAVPTSPLLQEQGFYTLEPGRRLFVMPFQGSALGHSFDPTEPVRYMWQLSFRDEQSDEEGDDNDNASQSQSSPEDLLREAKDRTAGWHDPVSWLLAQTDMDDIWGTMLHDRDPTSFAVPTNNDAPVIVAGDALHAMSPFKGQGANQSLQDALTIAKWIGGSGGQRHNSRSVPVLAACQRELVQRTAPIVHASRVAAQYWHSDVAVQATHAWTGLTDPAPLVAALAVSRDVHVNTTTNIDEAVRKLVREMNLNDVIPSTTILLPAQHRPPMTMERQHCSEAHAAAQAGCLRTLRRLSFADKDSVRDSDCLPIAAQAGQLRAVHWLIKEGGCCPVVDFTINDHDDDDDDNSLINDQVRVLMNRLKQRPDSNREQTHLIDYRV